MSRVPPPLTYPSDPIHPTTQARKTRSPSPNTYISPTAPQTNTSTAHSRECNLPSNLSYTCACPSPPRPTKETSTKLLCSHQNFDGAKTQKKQCTRPAIIPIPKKGCRACFRFRRGILRAHQPRRIPFPSDLLHDQRDPGSWGGICLVYSSAVCIHVCMSICMYVQSVQCRSRTVHRREKS